jgi:long-chain acyl-CoA synthetase
MADEPGPLTPLHAADVCGATFFPTVPAWLAALVKIGSPPPWPRSLRLVVAAGAVLPAAVAAHFRSAFGLPVHVFYGASECGGVTYDRRGDAAEHGSVGTPVDGVSIELDDDGIVSVLSAAVASGYIGDGSDRLQPGRFVSGDLATWDQDRLVLRGRADDVINIKGKKFSPREVEAVIASMPGVDDVAVLSVAGPNDVAVVRAVVATTLQELSYDAVVAWCRARLADYKVPRSVLLVPELPRTERGKLDRAALSS